LRDAGLNDYLIQALGLVSRNEGERLIRCRLLYRDLSREKQAMRLSSEELLACSRRPFVEETGGAALYMNVALGCAESAGFKPRHQ